MNNYHYELNGEQLGPVTFEQLKGVGITRTTLVWKEGMNDWTIAEDVEELNEIFKSVPPPINKGVIEKPKKSRKGIWIAASAIVLVGVGVLMLIQFMNREYSNRINNLAENKDEVHKAEIKRIIETPKSEEQLQAELQLTESGNPKKYISATYNYRYRLLAEYYEVNGTLSSSATLATFKDPQIRLDYFTKTGTKLGSELFSVYKFLKPRGSASFKLRADAPRATSKIELVIVDAKPVF